MIVNHPRKNRRIGYSISIIGFLLIIYSGFSFATTQRIVDLDPITINQETNHLLQWSPIVGIVLIIGGLVISVMGKKTKI